MEEDINRIARPHPPPPELIQSFGTSTPISFKSETRNSRSRATSKYPRDNPKILRALGRGSGNTDYFEMCFDVRASVSNVYPPFSRIKGDRFPPGRFVLLFISTSIEFSIYHSDFSTKERKNIFELLLSIYLLQGSDAFSRKQRYYGPIWANLHLLALHHENYRFVRLVHVIGDERLCTNIFDIHC